MKSGSTKSCGCLRREISRAKIKHGDSQSRLYNIFRGINQRCYSPNYKDYFKYGGRGIITCSEWKGLSQYNNFKIWAEENGYKADLTLDRINNLGIYEPSNCRWVDYKTQNNNRRSNHFVRIDGVSKTISQWADYSGLSKQVILERLNRGHCENDLLKPLPLKARLQSGVKGVVWKEKANRWEVYNKKKYVGFSKNLNEAILLKEKYLAMEE